MKVLVFMLKDWLFAGWGGAWGCPAGAGYLGRGIYLMGWGAPWGLFGALAELLADGCCSMIILVKF